MDQIEIIKRLCLRKGVLLGYRFDDDFKKSVIASAIYSLSSSCMPTWFPKKNEFRMIIREFSRDPLILCGRYFITGCSAMFPAITGLVSISPFSRWFTSCSRLKGAFGVTVRW